MVFKNPYDGCGYAISLTSDEEDVCFYLVGERANHLHGFERSFCRILRWQEIPYDQYVTETINKISRRLKVMANVDETLLNSGVKLINTHHFWIKEMTQKKHTWTILHKKTGRTFDISIREFCAAPTPEKALELVETQFAIANVVESGK